MPSSSTTLACLVGLALLAPAETAPAAETAAAQESAALLACHSETDAERGLAACTRVIDDAAAPASVRAQALLRRAFLYNRTGRHDLGRLDYARAVEVDPTNTEARRMLAHIRASSGHHEQAVAEYSNVIRIDPRDADAYRGRGDVRLSQKRYDEAIADYRMALQLKPVASSTGWGQCQASASVTNAAFHCLQVTDDTSQPADIRADAQRRLDRMMGRTDTPR
jgi:Tfp pilus assembly protein PilF